METSNTNNISVSGVQTWFPAPLYRSVYVIDDGHDEVSIGFESSEVYAGFIVRVTRAALVKLQTTGPESGL